MTIVTLDRATEPLTIPGFDPAHPMRSFDYDRDWRRAYAETNDPRVLAVIEVDPEPSAPDYDAQAPTLIAYEWGSRADFRQIGGRSDVPEAWLMARQEWDEETADRFIRIFYNAEPHYLRSSIDQYTWAVVFDAPDWRNAMGIDPGTKLTTENLAGEVKAYLDGDVYGIGYAINEGRVMFPDGGDCTPDYDDFDVTIECWGFYGDDWAARATASFEYGMPDLDPLLPIPATA